MFGVAAQVATALRRLNATGRTPITPVPAHKLNVFGTDTETPEYQLFDMRQDPQELTNRASDPELQAVKNHLQNILNAHQIPTTTHEVCS